MALLQAVLSDPNQTVVTYPKLTAEDETDAKTLKENIFKKTRKNWRQILNILPGILLLWTAGSQILWEIREITIERKHQDENLGDHIIIPSLEDSNFQLNLTEHVEVESFSGIYTEFFLLISTWHIGIALGSVFGALLNKVLTVKTIYILNAILILVTALFNIAISQVVLNALLFSDTVLAGIIYGLNHVTVVCHAADNSAGEFRGTVLRLVCYSKWFIILWASQVFFIGYATHITFVEIGFIYVIVSILVSLATYFCVYNSFGQSLQKGISEETVKHDLCKIRNDITQPHKSQQVLNDIKLQLSEDQTAGWNILSNGNIRPLLLVAASRILSVLVNNIPSLVIIISWFWVGVDANTNTKIDAVSSALFIVLTLKFLIGIGSVFLADCIGFHRFYYILGIVYAILLIILLNFPNKLLIIVVICSFFIIGLGIDAISYNHLSEAFPITKRALSIAIIHIIESIIEIGLLALYLLIFPATLIYPIAIGIIIISGCLLKWLPNTHNESLRNARNLFNTAIGQNDNQRYELTRLDAH